uniref:alkaline phosphatase n=1 Tax=Cacopsylla melanoneura TaxID=428564 RepID=A0A8D8ZEE1_9HEMI
MLGVRSLFTLLFLVQLVFLVQSGERQDDENMHDFSDFQVGAKSDRTAKSNIRAEEKESEYWIKHAVHHVHHRVNCVKPNTKIAKNIILFLGDGMGVSTQTAARIYQGQLNGQNGEENSLFFETLPYSGVSKTYCVDAQVADSACTSTAYTNGVKASIGTMGLNAKVSIGDCKASKDSSTHTSSIVDWAIKAGKSTGVVTTTRITHASPGGNYAHIASRDWECDTDRPKGVDCEDIASQLINQYPGNKINVLLGGGRSKFTLQGNVGGGQRLDKDLLKSYADMRTKAKESYSIAKTVWDLEKVNASNTDYLLGLFAEGHMNYKLENHVYQPTLEEMTVKAIEILSKNKNGFYLFVEGGKIDMAHHSSQAKKALSETIEFDNAIKRAYNMTKHDETLIVVTADHSHTFTMAGYPERGTNILAKARYGGQDFQGEDKLPYLTLGYNNGPGGRTSEGQRRNVSGEKTDDDNYVFPSGINLKSETHGGEDVLVFATGPWAHILTGSFEQNFIPVAMSYAARIGPGNQVPLVSGESSLLLSGSQLQTLLMSLGMVVVCKLLKDT